jgi:endonuclease/exonuclease/phosphatase (EEP) superfamily protein YafD
VTKETTITPPSDPQPRLPLLPRLLTIVGGTTVLALLLGYCGHMSWFCDLFSHFRLQYAVVLAVVASLLALLRHHQRAGAFALMAVVSALPILSLYHGGASAAVSTAPAATLRIMLANVNTVTGDPVLVCAEIERQNPDVVVLQEVNQEWLQALAPVTQHYAYRQEQPRPDNFGIALYSRLPLTNSTIATIGSAGSAGVPSITAGVRLAGRTLTLVATHPLPPASHALAKARNEQLGALVAHLNAINGPRLLVGDLNTTPWNVYFKQLLKVTGLRDSMRGFGYQASWPVGLPLLGIPLDHCLHSSDITVTGRALGAAVGSDHRPLIIDLALGAE